MDETLLRTFVQQTGAKVGLLEVLVKALIATHPNRNALTPHVRLLLEQLRLQVTEVEFQSGRAPEVAQAMWLPYEQAMQEYAGLLPGDPKPP